MPLHFLTTILCSLQQPRTPDSVYILMFNTILSGYLSG
jgi:hypothetical protein